MPRSNSLKKAQDFYDKKLTEKGIKKATFRLEENVIIALKETSEITGRSANSLVAEAILKMRLQFKSTA